MVSGKPKYYAERIKLHICLLVSFRCVLGESSLVLDYWRRELTYLRNNTLISPTKILSCQTADPFLVMSQMSSTNAAIMKGIMPQVIVVMVDCSLSTKMIPGRKIITNSLEMLPKLHRFLCERNTLQFCGTEVNAFAFRACEVRLPGYKEKMMLAWIESSE